MARLPITHHTAQISISGNCVINPHLLSLPLVKPCKVCYYEMLTPQLPDPPPISDEQLSQPKAQAKHHCPPRTCLGLPGPGWPLLAAEC